MKIQLIPIQLSQLATWSAMRIALYGPLDAEFNAEFNTREMQQILASDDCYGYFVVDETQQPIGMVELSSRNRVDVCLSSPVAYIEGLFLQQAYRGKGLGEQIIKLIKVWSQQHGYTELACDSELSNVNAQAFFKAMNFEETYRVVQFKTRL